MNSKLTKLSWKRTLYIKTIINNKRTKIQKKVKKPNKIKQYELRSVDKIKAQQ